MKMSSTLTLVLLLMSVLCVEVNCQCSPIGTNNEMEFTAVRERRLYLNTQYPAPCGGTIDRMNHCYYRPTSVSSNERYRATWAVYRKMGSGNNISYAMVASSLRTFGRRGDRSPLNSNDGDFWCRAIDVTDFRIEAGDIVGACIYEPSQNNREQLDIVGQANGYSLMQMSSVNQCDINVMPSTILHSQLETVASRILHLYAIITNPIIPTTLPPTTTASTTEQTTSVVWNTTIPSDTTAPDATTTAAATSTTMTTSSIVANSTQTDATTAAVSTVNDTTTTASIVSQPMATTSRSDSTVVNDATTMVDRATTSESETVSTAQTRPEAATTLSTVTDDGDVTSGESDTITTVESDNFVSTIAQVGAQNNRSVDPKIIIGVVVAVILLIVTGLVVAIIVAAVFKKRGKGVGGYSPPGRKPLSNGTGSVRIASNGVDNLMYDAGFHNPGTLDSSFNLYDDVANSVTVSTGEGNYFELAESGISNLTYESVNAAGIYSELSAAHSTDAKDNHSYHNPCGGTSHYELEYYSPPTEDSKESLSFLLERNKQEDIYGNLEAYYAPAANEDEIYSQLKSCGTNNIPHVHIRIMGHLGSGQFGNVEKGMWQNKEVALKTLKTDSTDEDKVKFLQEAAIMAQFKHPNIVTLHGVVSDKEPLMLVVELMHRGDLRDHLHSIRPDPGELPMAGLSEKLLIFSQHVALGMQYLSGKGFVHRDLAARNILVSRDNICKVADFGMSRDLADETYYVSHGGMIPVKWTAPEAIHYKKYSTASDVWSYGCLLYEIWSLGYKPFEGVTNVEVIKLLDSNKRLSPPPGCPRMIYELMIKCWDPIAGSRPRFREVAIVLTGNAQEVLSIPQEALGAHKLAGVLGSPLEAGKNMYCELQNKYCSENVYE